MPDSPGYRGFVALQVMAAASLSAPSGLALPVTNAGIIQAPQFNFPEIDGTTSPVNFAEVQRRYNGGFGGPLFLGSGASLYHGLMNLALDQRYGGQLGSSFLTDDAQPSLAYGPKAVWVHQYEETGKVQVFYRYLCRTLTLRSTAGGIVEYTMDGLGYNRQIMTTAALNLFNTPTTTANANYTPIPHWNTAVQYSVDGSTWTTYEVTNWELTINNNTIETYGSAAAIANPSANLNPSKLNQGLITVSGSFTLVTPVTLADPSGSNFARIRIVLAVAQGAGGSPPAKTIICPNIVFTGYPVPLPGTNVRILRTYSFQSLGDGTNQSAYTANYS